MKKIIAVDFDGTLVEDKYPIIGYTNLKLVNWIKENRDKYIFILYTCRHDRELQVAVDFLKNNYDLEFDYINENVKELIEKYGDTRKIYADYYIDDKNINIGDIYETL